MYSPFSETIDISTSSSTWLWRAEEMSVLSLNCRKRWHQASETWHFTAGSWRKFTISAGPANSTCTPAAFRATNERLVESTDSPACCTLLRTLDSRVYCIWPIVNNTRYVCGCATFVSTHLVQSAFVYQLCTAKWTRIFLACRSAAVCIGLSRSDNSHCSLMLSVTSVTLDWRNKIKQPAWSDVWIAAWPLPTQLSKLLKIQRPFSSPLHTSFSDCTRCAIIMKCTWARCKKVAKMACFFSRRKVLRKFGFMQSMLCIALLSPCWTSALGVMPSASSAGFHLRCIAEEIRNIAFTNMNNHSKTKPVQWYNAAQIRWMNDVKVNKLCRRVNECISHNKQQRQHTKVLCICTLHQDKHSRFAKLFRWNGRSAEVRILASLKS